MDGKLDPATAAQWQDYYRAAERRRRLAGWHRRGPSKSRRGFDAGRLLAIVMSVATIAVVLCLAIPS